MSALVTRCSMASQATLSAFPPSLLFKSRLRASNPTLFILVLSLPARLLPVHVDVHPESKNGDDGNLEPVEPLTHDSEAFYFEFLAQMDIACLPVEEMRDGERHCPMPLSYVSNDVTSLYERGQESFLGSLKRDVALKEFSSMILPGIYQLPF
jgi:hypothetical protein